MQAESAMLQSPAPLVPEVPFLIERLIDAHAADWVAPDTLESWLAVPGHAVLFIAGDPVRFPECLDVAVVLPELRAALGVALRIGIAQRAAEETLARRYGATRRPALVFLRDGAYLGNVSGMLDWDDYLREVAAVLAGPVSRPPGIGIPLTLANPSDCQ